MVGLGLLAMLVLKPHAPQPVVVNVPQIAQPSKAVADAPKVDLPVAVPVKVYKGGAALKGGLKLPPPVVQDDNKQVIASSTTPANDNHPHTITTVIDAATGEATTYDKEEPLPWLAWDRGSAVGIYAGIKNGEPAVRLQARQDLFSVKALHVGAIASVDQMASGPISADYFVGIGAEYRW